MQNDKRSILMLKTYKPAIIIQTLSSKLDGQYLSPQLEFYIKTMVKNKLVQESICSRLGLPMEFFIEECLKKNYIKAIMLLNEALLVESKSELFVTPAKKKLISNST